MAASYQGADVAANSLFALAQSTGAAGMASSTYAGATITGAAGLYPNSNEKDQSSTQKAGE